LSDHGKAIVAARISVVSFYVAFSDTPDVRVGIPRRGAKVEACMTVSDEIRATRHFGVVRCGILSLEFPNVSALAHAFGLRSGEECYREIDETSAREAVLRLLHIDLAYDAEVMPKIQAEQLSARFFDQFGVGSRYFTNNWCPVTDATFDEGVLVTGPDLSGCFWVEDED
jgi:hypothetical protein